MMKGDVIDVHCHWFNIKYPIKELSVATWNMIWGNYPHHGMTSEKKDERIYRGLRDSTIDRYAKWIASIAKALFSSSDENYKKMEEQFLKSSLGHERKIKMVPLMMDLYYSLHNNGDELTDVKAKGVSRSSMIKPFEISNDQPKQFSDHVDKIRQRVLDAIRTDQKLMRGTKSDFVGDQLYAVFEQIKSELQQGNRMVRGSIDQYNGIELSPGFLDQMQDLEELQAKHSDQVFPFLAVDPRRIGIIDLIQKKVDKNKGPFFGIKLYTPLGYLPTHPKLAPIFDYCQDAAIPITTHTSCGGVKNFCNKIYVSSKKSGVWKDFKKTDKSAFFADPDNWIPVLDQWRNLRLNLSHFGGGDQFANSEHNWREKITKLLKNPKHKYVFTDISYFTGRGSAEQVLSFLRENPYLSDRLLFGTDFVMIVLDCNMGGLHQYFSNFVCLPNEILSKNALNFLDCPALR